MKNLKGILWGVILIAVGVLIGLNEFDLIKFDIFFNGWWTLLIIVPSLIGIVSSDDKMSDLIGLIVGVVLLLCCQGYIEFSLVWKLLLPTILVIIGVTWIFKDKIGKEVSAKIKEFDKTDKDANEYNAAFAGQKLNFDGENFKGCTFNATCGGFDVDLRKAKIKKEAIIKISAVFGGVSIKVPKDVNVKVSSNSIFGGVENKIEPDEDAKTTIYVEATCLFGGVEIK